MTMHAALITEKGRNYRRQRAKHLVGGTNRASGVGRNGLERLLKVIEDGEYDRVPPAARDCDQLDMVRHQILDADRRILALAPFERSQSTP